MGWGAFSSGAFVDLTSYRTAISRWRRATPSNGVPVRRSALAPLPEASVSRHGPSNPWIVTGISGSGPYYFRAAGILGSCAAPTATGPWSAPSPAMTIAAPTGNAVSGTVTIPSTIKPTGRSTWASTIPTLARSTQPNPTPAPSNSTPNAYSVNVPTGSNYVLFGILDQNKTGVINAIGEISNTNVQNMTLVPITGATANENLDLTPYTASAQASVHTQNTQSTGLDGVTTNNYSLGFRVQGLVKLPAPSSCSREPTACRELSFLPILSRAASITTTSICLSTRRTSTATFRHRATPTSWPSPTVTAVPKHKPSLWARRLVLPPTLRLWDGGQCTSRL